MIAATPGTPRVSEYHVRRFLVEGQIRKIIKICLVGRDSPLQIGNEGAGGVMLATNITKDLKAQIVSTPDCHVTWIRKALMKKIL